MSCKNKISYHIPKGYDYKEVFVKCGTTDPFGNRAICDECYSNPAKMKGIKQQEENAAADNAWLESAGWGEI